MSDWIQEGVEGFFEDQIQKAIEILLIWMAELGGLAVGVLDLPVVSQGILYAQGVAGTILVTKIAWESWLNHILRLNGDSEADPGGVLIRFGAAGAMIGGVPWLTKWIFEIGTAFAMDVATFDGVDYARAGGAVQSLVDINIGSIGIIGVAAVLFAVIIFIVIGIQTVVRAAELALAAVVGVFMALGLSNPNSQTISTWQKETTNLALSQPIQLFLVKVSFFMLTYSEKPIVSLFLFCGFMWITFKSPTILKQYIYSSGVGKSAGGVAQQAGSAIMMRRMMTMGR